MDSARYLEVLSERAGALLLAATESMEALVPTCPGWTVADLVVHVGGVWGWAADIVTTGSRAEGREPPGERSERALRAWASEEGARLVAALGAADPDADCWTFGLPRTTRFWFRRQALETTVHAWDVGRAVGRPTPIDGELAADGIDEHLFVIVPRAVRRSPGAWSGESVHFHRTDGDGEWIVRLGPEGEVTTSRAHTKADLALRGTAEALWLWSTNRQTADAAGIERFGDEAIAARWRTDLSF